MVRRFVLPALLVPVLSFPLLSSTALAAKAAPPPAAPGGCDAKALTAALVAASPGPSAQAYMDLAACDAGAAKAATPEAFKRILPGTTGDAAALVAIGLGQGESVRSWLTALESDERAGALNKLGEACEKPGVTAFWLETEKLQAEKFWSNRWYAALDACRVPDARALLAAKVSASKNDRVMFSSVLDTFATNAGADSIATIRAIAEQEATQKSPDPLVYIDLVRVLPSAGGVGDPAGANIDRLRAATEALNGMAPTLPERAITEARKAYLALGDEVASDHLVALRYKSVLQDSKLLYGVVAVEKATCKKGDVRVTLHAAPVWDAGRTWPDQLAERVKPNADNVFEPNLAETCKGTGTVEYVVPEAPFASMADYNTWVVAQKQVVDRANAGVTVKQELEKDAITD